MLRRRQSEPQADPNAEMVQGGPGRVAATYDHRPLKESRLHHLPSASKYLDLDAPLSLLFVIADPSKTGLVHTA